MANEVIISIKAKDSSSQAVQNVIKNLEKLGVTATVAQANTQKFEMDWASFMTGLSQSLMIIDRVGAGIQKAFDLSRQGAQVVQTERAFASMMETMGEGTGILDEWRDAVNGTISDMGLMSGTQTVLAGTSEELGKALLDNNAQLLEIAKAASALNPRLGDTAFMYDSITRGIKRSSPLILDNLGIVVKIGKANEDYAKSLGKTVEELTAEEQTMALLNGTLEAGDRLIQQLGGSVESAIDPWDRFTTSLENANNELLKNGTFLGDFFGEFADMMNVHSREWSRENAFKILKNDLLEAGYSVVEFNNAWAGNKNFMGWIEDTEYADKVLGDMRDRLNEVIIAEDRYSRATEASALSSEIATADIEYFGRVAQQAGVQISSLADETSKLSAENERVFSVGRQLGPQVAEITDANRRLLELMKLQKEEGYGVYDGVYYSAQGLKDEIANVIGNIDQMRDSMTEATGNMILDLYKAQLASDGVFDAADLERVVRFGESLGLETKAGTLEAIKWLDVLNRYELADKYMRIIIEGGDISSDLAWVQRDGRWYNTITGQWSDSKPGRASGGSVSAGGAYWVGEAGPELFMPSAGGRVLSNSQSMSAIGSAMDPYYREEQKQTTLLEQLSESMEDVARYTGGTEEVMKNIGGPEGYRPLNRPSSEEIDRAIMQWSQDPESRYMSMRYGFEGVPGWETIVNACKAIETWVPYFGLNITGKGFTSQTPANPRSAYNAPFWVLESVKWNEWMEQEWQSLQEQWEMGYSSFGITKEYVKRMWIEQQILNAHYRIALEEAFEAGKYISYGQWFRANKERLKEEARPPGLQNRYNKQKTFDPVTGLPIDVPGRDAVGMASGGQTGSGLVGYGEDLTTGTVIGEGGPEVFVAAKAGRVMSNSDLMKAFGGAGAGGLGFANFNINITSAINMADRAWVERELMPYIRKGIREYLR